MNGTSGARSVDLPLSGTVMGRRFVAYLTLDSPQDATKAMAVVRKLS
jgi:hypothetical protein